MFCFMPPSGPRWAKGEGPKNFFHSLRSTNCTPTFKTVAPPWLSCPYTGMNVSDKLQPADELVIVTINKHYYVLSNSALSNATVTDLFAYLDRLSLQNLCPRKKFAPPAMRPFVRICWPLVCKRSLGWINYDNYVHITQRKRKIYTELRRFVRQRRTSSGMWSRDVADEHVTKIQS